MTAFPQGDGSDPTRHLAGRTAVVTAGAAGIGHEICRVLADAGATVVALDRDAGGLARLAADIPGCRIEVVDLADPEALDESDDWGADILVNNVASLTPVRFHAATDADIEHDVALTLTLPMRLTRRVLPTMIARGRGIVVNIASVNGLGGYGNEAYSAAKAGLIGFTRSIAVEYGDRGIRCNAVAPGSVRTAAWDARVEADPDVLTSAARSYPLGRIGRPADVAAAVMFLVSDAAEWITGVCLPVDGGLTAGNLQLARDITVDTHP